MFAYIYIYIYIYTRTHTHTHMCVCVCVCVYLETPVSFDICSETGSILCRNEHTDQLKNQELCFNVPQNLRNKFPHLLKTVLLIPRSVVSSKLDCPTFFTVYPRLANMQARKVKRRLKSLGKLYIQAKPLILTIGQKTNMIKRLANWISV